MLTRVPQSYWHSIMVLTGKPNDIVYVCNVIKKLNANLEPATFWMIFVRLTIGCPKTLLMMLE